MLSQPLPLTIACLVALLPIRVTYCGDPLIWASVEAQAEFRTKPDGAPGGECSLPSTFQMRADGSWLPSSEFDLTGNFDEDCGIFLHYSMPEDEPDGGEELRSKIKLLVAKKEELQKKEDNLSKDKKDHNDKMVELENEKGLLNSSKEKIKVAEGEKKALNEKKEDLTRKRNTLEDKLKKLGITDLNSFIEKLAGKDKIITQTIADEKKKAMFLNEILSGVCIRIPTSLYLSIVEEAEVSSDTKIYLCHKKGPNYSYKIEEMWNTETTKMEEKMKSLKKDMDNIESKELALEDEKRVHAENFKKLGNEKDTLSKMKTEFSAIRSELEDEKVREKAVLAKKKEVEEKRNRLDKIIGEKESKISHEYLRVQKEIELLTKLLALSEENECDTLPDADYLIIKDVIKYHKQDILVCEPQ